MAKRRTIPARIKAQAALDAVRGEQTINQIAAKYEVHPNQISQWKRHLTEQMDDLFRDRRTRDQQDHEALVAQLYQQIGQLKFELDWLKKKSAMTTDQRRAAVDPGMARISVARQCELLGISRGTYYYCPAPIDPRELLWMRLLDEEYTRHPFYGVERMVRYLRSLGHRVGPKRVRRLLRQMGLFAVGPKPNTSKPHPGHTIYPYLLRGLDIKGPNHVWSTDITYIRMPGGFVYLTAVIDWFSRYVLSWKLSLTLESEFCIQATQEALSQARPEIFNTDQGSQFTSKEFTELLLDHEVKISMDGRGRALDNVFVERLWRTVKYEEIYLKDYSTVREAKLSLRDYFDFYNHQRWHSSLGWRLPAEVYAND